MCRVRRVFYSCLHEDYDVTPPRAILYCSWAVPNVGSSSSSGVRPCASVQVLPLTDRDDVFAGIVRSVPCDVCAGLPGPGNDGTTYYRNPWLVPPMVAAEAAEAEAGPEVESNEPVGQESASHDDNDVDIDTLLERLDAASLQDELDVFDFAWDGDNRQVAESAGIEDASNATGNPTDNGQPIGTPGSGEGPFYSNGETDLNQEIQSATRELQDLQLYDEQEEGQEFADELNEIGSDTGKETST
ncbi:uncharacterized protein F4807DRAFT_466048 [Annulohypoxylon truncatum]|uniref:uncharacterized protein n=1 Tax=Annulohypoxylon truncatum TaxID=327061 RepID=UPI002008BC23|nr:uncharacterized protein F4807DRAFT_466048 [Annulohypoxylon truncatum]KAI1204074.1 hypothetical protein F4807DRAFT_466048 [Annulohypoxylon truncatum]